MFDTVSAREIAVSGLRAQRARMNVIALNIANAETTRTPDGGGAFRRQLAILETKRLTPGAKAEEAGVQVKRIIKDTSPLREVYNPAHPDANADGYVSYPNINLAVEMSDMISAQRAYEANVAVIVSRSRMHQRALEIIQK